jgi:hypothetical protein
MAPAAIANRSIMAQAESISDWQEKLYGMGGISYATAPTGSQIYAANTLSSFAGNL